MHKTGSGSLRARTSANFELYSVSRRVLRLLRPIFGAPEHTCDNTNNPFTSWQAYICNARHYMCVINQLTTHHAAMLAVTSRDPIQLTNENKCLVLEVLYHDDGLIEDHVVVLKLPTVVGGVHDLPLLFPLPQTSRQCLAVQSAKGLTPGGHEGRCSKCTIKSLWSEHLTTILSFAHTFTV